MFRDAFVVTAALWALVNPQCASSDAGPEQSGDTTYATRISTGVVTFWLHPRWRDAALEVEAIVFSHSVHVTSAQLEDGVRLVVNGVESAPARVGPWHLDAVTLVFRAPKRPSHFQIKIRNVPDIPVRVLTW
jgi:hypothetical protein